MRKLYKGTIGNSFSIDRKNETLDKSKMGWFGSTIGN